MIRVALSQLFIYYLIAILSGLLAIWLFGDWRRKRKEKQARRFHLVCNICGITYEDRTNDDIPPCPKCGARNERAALRDL